MYMLIFDSIISFVEMFISCFFAAGIFRKDRKEKRTVNALILFAVAGTVLLTIRENIFLWIPDFVPSVLIFTLFSIMICRTTKEDSLMHGYGMKNIDSIVQKYDGYCERNLNDHVFRCRIRILG